LHEGQVLVTTTPTDYIGPVTNYLDPTETAVRSTVIDFGLSRLTVNGAPVATPLPDECYEGVGAQWDVYRAMQTLIGPSPDAWDSFVPSTNVLWLLYLVRRLLHATPTLRKPTARRGGTTKTTAAAKRDNAIRDRCEAAYTLLLAVEAELSTPTARGKRTKTGACGFTSAAEVMAWGRKEGWVE
jgi:serine/threonine-protein kinase haspin